MFKRALLLCCLPLACTDVDPCGYSVSLSGEIVGGCGQEIFTTTPEACSLIPSAVRESDAGFLEVATADARRSGRYYVEVVVDEIPEAAWQGIGVAESGMGLMSDSLRCMYSAGGLHECGEPGSAFANGFDDEAFGPTLGAGSVLQMAIDLDGRRVWFGVDGRWVNGNPALDEGGGSLGPNPGCRPLRPVAFLFEGDRVRFNVGDRPFAFAAPAGFAAGFGAGCDDECNFTPVQIESCELVVDPDEVSLEYPPSTPTASCDEQGNSSYENAFVQDECYALELHLVSVYEAEDRQDGPITVSVAARDKPIYLALRSYESVEWVIELEPGAVLEVIDARAYDETPRVSGDVEGANLILDGRADFFAHAWEDGASFTELVTEVRAAAQMMESSFQGCYAGSRFEL